MFCPKCGKEQIGNVKFCNGCGEKIKFNVNQNGANEHKSNSLIMDDSTDQNGRAAKGRTIKSRDSKMESVNEIMGGMVHCKSEKVFEEIQPENMKSLVIQAAKLTKKYGLTAYSIAMGGRLKFKGNKMGIAIGRKAASMGGIGGQIFVIQANGGSKVRIVWEEDRENCKKAAELFWKNLEAVLQPGGFQLSPRSTALNVGTALLFCLTAYYLLSVVLTFIVFEATDETSYPMGGTIIWSILALIAGIQVLRRRSWGFIFVVCVLAVIGSVLSPFIMLGLGLIESPIDAIEPLIVFAVALTTAILFKRTKHEFY